MGMMETVKAGGGRLSPEIEEMREIARRIVRDELLPLEREYLASRDHAYTGYAVDNLRQVFGPAVSDRLVALSKETGFWDLLIPAEHGGADLSLLAKVVIDETFHYSAVPFPMPFLPNVLFECRGDQVDKYLRPVLDGSKQVAFAQTEADAGSDPGGTMKTRARRINGEWLLTGSKMWISGALQSDFMLVLAVTDPEKRQHGGITMFLVDTIAPGVTVDAKGLSTWLSPRPAQYVVTFDEVRLTDAQVLGEVGLGFRLGQRFLAEYDRLLRGPYALGKMQRALDLSVDWAKQRVTFGKPIADRQAIQWHLVDMYVDIQALRTMTYDAAVLADGKEDIRSEAALIKLCAGEWGARCLDRAIQVHGGMGESDELPLTLFYRLLRHARIGGGADEIQRMLIARSILGRRSN